MQEPAELRRPAAVVQAAVDSSRVLALIALVTWLPLRSRRGPNGGILAVIRAVIRFTNGNVEADTTLATCSSVPF